MKIGLALLLPLLALIGQVPALAETPTYLVLFDPVAAEWHIRAPDGSVARFQFGEPGDVPLWGDWDCDGVDSAAVFRDSRHLVIRGAPESGDATFELAVADAMPLTGDWNGNGCDTVSAFRYDRVFIINELGGGVDDDYYFGILGDVPLAGDFDGDGISSVGVFRPSATGFGSSSGHMYLRNSLDTGAADIDYEFGEDGDYVTVGDWNGDGRETPALFKNAAFHVRLDHSGDAAATVVEFGRSGWVPAGGLAGPPPAVRGRVLLILIIAIVATMSGLLVLRWPARAGSPESVPQPTPSSAGGQ